MSRCVVQSVRGRFERVWVGLAVTVALCVGTAHGVATWSAKDSGGGVVAVLACGQANAPELAVQAGQNGDTVVHAIVGSADELRAFNRAIAEAGLKGIVSAEQLGLSALPYRDDLVNTLVIMDLEKARVAGLTLEEARRCVAPFGTLVTCRGGQVEKTEVMPLPKEMDVWTHHYYKANGIPASSDQVFDLPVGFKWNGGLPMNFDNPVRAANRYSSTRAMLIDDGRCFTFSEAVYGNLGTTWKSEYGTDQALTCRDAFNGRLLWRRRIGQTYYGGLYIENLAPMVCTDRRLYLAGQDGRMWVIDTRTGETLRELPTTYIPGVIAASDGIVVAATWKGGKSMGSVKHYDRRRMDWAIDTGTIEAYDDATGKLLWRQDLLGTSLLISEGRVLIVNRTAADPIEENHGKPLQAKTDKTASGEQPTLPGRPINRVMALNLDKGTVLWECEDGEIGVANQRISLEAATSGSVAVASGGRNQVKILSAETGKLLDANARSQAEKLFFRFRNHICTPVFHVNDIVLENRGGRIVKDKEAYNYGGARSACLIGTVPAYGTGYIAQNWCNCSPGQIPGLIAITPIGREPEPSEMEAAASPTVIGGDKEDYAGAETQWVSFRGNACRNSSAPCGVATNVTVTWSRKVVQPNRKGTVAREWLDCLNSRITAAVLADGMAILADLDQDEVIAVNRADGAEVWRYPVACRMDTPPTICKGICLVGDHSGYVTALNVKTGEPVYRLRVAPEEKRMLSYGKVESVWPVIGGVLVADDRAYASAGRTQGSDGGLVVRAFKPRTGEPIWARALPQKGNGVIETKPRRNDSLFMENGLLRIMDHRLNPETGEIVLSALGTAIAEAKAAKEKELGHKPDRREEQKLEADVRKANPEREVSMGNEGLHSWNWTRLGHRKFQHIGYAGLNGDTLSWNERYVACGDSRRGRIAIKALDGRGGANHALPKEYLATALVLCNNVVLAGGTIDDPKGGKGFVRAIGLADGKTVWERTFDAELAFDGLAVDRGAIIASLHDGTIVKLQ